MKESNLLPCPQCGGGQQELQQDFVVPEPFMFVKLNAGDVMDWTQDPSLAEYWAEEGDTVAELYSGHDLRLSPHLQPDAVSVPRELLRRLNRFIMYRSTHDNEAWYQLRALLSTRQAEEGE